MIKNFRQLAITPLRKKALEIIKAAYQAIDIEKAIRQRVILKNNKLSINHIFPYNHKTISETTNLALDDFERIFISGVGKGSALACLVLSRILAKRLTKTISLDIEKQKLNLKDKLFLGLNSKIEAYVGTHPLPSEINIQATQKIIGLAKDLKDKDLLLFFVCGGGSALACVSKQEFEASSTITKALTKAGANIIELNTIRKHLSEFKGGGLAKFACPGTVISLIISDVCGNDLSMVASGPTVFDKTTKAEAENILRKYGLESNQFPLIETPKEEKYLNTTKNILLVCSQDAVMNMVYKTRKLGFNPLIYSLGLQGEAREIFKNLFQKTKAKTAVICAGETTVTFKDKTLGKGGRNQEAVLGALVNFRELMGKDVVAVSFASDAKDNTEAAGAIGDFKVLEKASKLKINPAEFLENHDSFNFFNKTGNLIFVEPKSFNVADLMLVLKE